MDELQSGPLMVKALMGRHFAGLSYPRRMVGGPMLSLLSYHD
jgi:hypothetical protein